MRSAARAASLVLAAVTALVLAGCTEGTFQLPDVSGRDVRVVTTTNFITDLARRVGGDRVQVTGLMGPGVDPHLYKASARDVRTLRQGDLVLYGGLDLEGKMDDVFEELGRRRPVTVVTDGIPRAELLGTDQADETYDPHVWFDVSLWMLAVEAVRDGLMEEDPEHAEEYAARAEAYLAELDALHAYVGAQAARVPPELRVLVTAHDAFNYFGRAYGFEVRGLQGISTASEAGTADVQELAVFIAGRRIPAVFVESSIPQRTIEAVRAAVRARGFGVEIGGQLYSDALGDRDSAAGTYVGMVKHNVDTIVSALLGGGRPAGERER